jgi:MFS family permease
MAPELIRRVGHVRVFAALASFISAVMILYPAFANPAAWFIGRVIIGFCFSGVYVTAESWLNNAADNDNRGKALSLYMIVQMVGIVSAQGLLLVGDPSGYETFVLASVVISISFAPILLSISPTPAFDTAKRMSLRDIRQISPLGVIGMFLLGGVFAAQFGMAAVYAAQAGMSLGQISAFVASFYIGAMLLQYPLGWLSDRSDRRVLIMGVAAIGGTGAVAGMFLSGQFYGLLLVGFVIGGMTGPLYSLLLAHTNDFLEHDDMAAAAGGMVFVNGLGAIAGPLVVGYLMGTGVFGPPGFFLVMAVLLFALCAYAAWRTTRRPSVSSENTGTMTPVYAGSSPLAAEWAQEVAIEADLEEQSLAENE